VKWDGNKTGNNAGPGVTKNVAKGILKDTGQKQKEELLICPTLVSNNGDCRPSESDNVGKRLRTGCVRTAQAETAEAVKPNLTALSPFFHAISSHSII